MKIMFSVNTWLYDIMIRSYPLWKDRNIEIVYDLLQEKQLKYLKKNLPDLDPSICSLFPESIIKIWHTVDISDKNITMLENKYGCRYIEMIIYDISMYKYDAIPYDKMRNEEYWRRYFVSTIRYYEDLLDKHTPDFIFGEGPHGMGMKILFEVSKKRRIPYFTIMSSYFNDKIMFTYGRTHKSFVLEYYYNNFKLLSEEDLQKAKEVINAIRFYKQMAYYQKRYGKKITLLPKNILRAFNVIGQSVAYWFYSQNSKNRVNFLLEGKSNPLWGTFALRFTKYNNYKYITRKCVKRNPKDNYIVYFNHFQPEATTSVWAPYYENQSNVIENIIKSLPGTLKLYIKEHSTDLGNRGRSFYENLFYYPPVRLIDPLSNSIELIKKCKMVFTISGTVGLEAIMLNKPVGVFCDCYYSFFPGVKRIYNPEEIPSAINWGLKKYNIEEPLIEKFVAAYIKSLYSTKVTFPFLEDERILGKKENLVKFANGILAFIEDYRRYGWDKYIENDEKSLSNKFIRRENYK